MENEIENRRREPGPLARTPRTLDQALAELTGALSFTDMIEAATTAPPAPAARLFGAPDRDSTDDAHINRRNRWISLSAVGLGLVLARALNDPAEAVPLALFAAEALAGDDQQPLFEIVSALLGDYYSIVSLSDDRLNLHFNTVEHAGDFARLFIDIN